MLCFLFVRLAHDDCSSDIELELHVVDDVLDGPLVVVRALLSERGLELLAAEGEDALGERNVARLDHLAARQVQHAVARPRLGVADQDARQSLRAHLALAITVGHVTIAVGSEDAQMRHVRLVSCPCVLRCDRQRQRTPGCPAVGSCSALRLAEQHRLRAVAQIGRGLHGQRPELGAQLRVLQHAAGHLEQRAVHALGDAVVLRRVRLCRCVLDSLSREIGGQLPRSVFASAVGVELDQLSAQPPLHLAAPRDDLRRRLRLARQRPRPHLSRRLVHDHRQVGAAAQGRHQLGLRVAARLHHDRTGQVGPHALQRGMRQRAFVALLLEHVAVLLAQRARSAH